MKHKKDYLIKIHLHPISLLLVIFLAGMVSCNEMGDKQDKQMDDPTAFTDQDRQDLLYIMELTERERPVAFDLSDDIQYRFMKRQLERAGKTPEDYPMTFQSLEQARNMHIESGVPDANSDLAMDAGATGTLIPMNVITEFGPDLSHLYDGAALSSIPGGTIMTQLTLGVYDQAGNTLGPLGVATTYGEGQDTDVRAEATDHPNPGVSSSDDSVSLVYAYYYQAQNGVPYTGGYTVRTVAYVSDIVNYDPEPVKHPGATVTEICLGRGSSSGDPDACDPNNPQSSDCDYCYDQGSYENVLMPISGYITYSDDIDPIVWDGDSATNAFSYIDIIQIIEGGGCPVLEYSGNFFKDPNTTISGNQLSWNLDPASFGSACYVHYGDSLTFNFVVRVSVDDQPVFATISNAKGTDSTNANTELIPKIYAKWGCLAADTEVTMTDGSQGGIDTLQVNRHVKSQDDVNLTIMNTSKGVEHIPMYRIQDSEGNNVLMTEEHPVITPDGVILAKNLNKGDQLYTVNGMSSVTGITTEIYDGSVWNLDLKSEDTNYELGLSNRTFFANNILVGDGYMQAYWAVYYRKLKPAKKENIGEEWYSEYMRHLELTGDKE